MRNNFKKIVVVIPAYEPGEKLGGIVDSLISQGFLKMVVVNDGSSKDKDYIFDCLEKKGAMVLKHEINRGKGEALKTAFKHATKFYADAEQIVTVDADGQHLPADVTKICGIAGQDSKKLYLGVREFKGKVPFRSMFGNVITKYIFAFIMKKKLKDTQTGLRVMPLALIPDLLDIKSSRYEFEMEMLQVAITKNMPIEQVPIATVYEKNNASSHFDPLVDSLKIYVVLFRYSLVSFASFLADYFLFLFFYNLFRDIFIASFSARILAVSLNFILVRNNVFRSKKNTLKSLTKYVILAGINPLISGGIIFGLNNFFHIPVYIAKIIAESLLFIFNFAAQKKFIF